MARRHIALLGLTGVGKTSVGTELASILDRPLLDSDRIIEERFGASGREIAATQSVSRLHVVEHEVTVEMLQRETPCVLGVPASAVDPEAVRSLIATHSRAVWLTAPAEVLTARMRAQSHRRSIDSVELDRLHDRRQGHFRELAEMVADTSTADPVETARSIVSDLGLTDGR